MTDPNYRLRQMQLADALRAYPTPQKAVPPRSGWVRAIREALGMTQAQLGARVGVSRQSVQDFEKSETERRITLDSLDRLARAMECRVVYALVPESGSLDSIRERRANVLVRALAKKAGHSMELEAQGVSTDVQERQHKLLVEALMSAKAHKLWK